MQLDNFYINHVIDRDNIQATASIRDTETEEIYEVKGQYNVRANAFWPDLEADHYLYDKFQELVEAR